MIKLSIILCAVLIASMKPATAETIKISVIDTSVVQKIAGQLLVEVNSKAGIDTTLVPMPAKRANAMAMAGKTDGEVARIRAYGNRFDTLTLVEPAYYQVTTAAFAKKSSGIVIDSADDLKNYKVAIERGVLHAARAVAGHPDVTEVSSGDQLFKMLDAGRVDVVVIGLMSGRLLTQSLGQTEITPVGSIANTELFAVLTEKNSYLAPRISTAIQEMKANGELQSLASKYEEQLITLE